MYRKHKATIGGQLIIKHKRVNRQVANHNYTGQCTKTFVANQSQICC
jgi:hypothetical protein